MRDVKDSNLEKKNIIYYSRDYRHLNVSGFLYALQFVFILVPIVFLYLNYYSRLSRFVAEFSAGMVNRIIKAGAYVSDTEYFKIFGGVSYVNMEGRKPSFTLAFISLLVSLFLIMVFSLAENDRKPMMIYITIGLYIHAASSAYFVLFADKFPYDLNSYSILYMKQQIVVWLMIIIVYWLSTSLITKMLLFRIVSLAIMSGILFVFGVTRYIIYMIILAKCSYLFMASLYFTFGVLFDFMIMVGVFAIFIRRASKKYNSREGGAMWEWS